MSKSFLWTLAVASLAAGETDPACRVENMKRIGTVGAGLDWHPTSNEIAIARPDAKGKHQIHIVSPDGADQRCLTCQQAAGGPKVDLHKGVPQWHDNGRYIFLQVEQEKHKAGAMAQPGSGRNNDIWAVTPSGDRWWQLTNRENGGDGGTLFPVPSHKGDKLAWAERFAGPRKPLQALAGMMRKNPPPDIWGRWRLAVADIVYGAGGTVSLANKQTLAPGNADFYEMQVWSPDDHAIYFAGSIDRKSPYTLDIWRYEWNGGKLTALTNTSDQWEEHIAFSRSGKKAVYMSSECCAWNSGDLRTLQAELYLMNGDGSDRAKLTSFNEPGGRDYDRTARSVVAKGVWSPDGRRVALARILINESNSEKRPTDLWILTFTGPCGR
jgi:hypothetical protein